MCCKDAKKSALSLPHPGIRAPLSIFLPRSADAGLPQEPQVIVITDDDGSGEKRAGKRLKELLFQHEATLIVLLLNSRSKSCIRRE